MNSLTVGGSACDQRLAPSHQHQHPSRASSSRNQGLYDCCAVGIRAPDSAYPVVSLAAVAAADNQQDNSLREWNLSQDVDHDHDHWPHGHLVVSDSGRFGGVDGFSGALATLGCRVGSCLPSTTSSDPAAAAAAAVATTTTTAEAAHKQTTSAGATKTTFDSVSTN